jgi:SagB-type dehydrogenase family enzyme
VSSVQLPAPAESRLQALLWQRRSQRRFAEDALSVAAVGRLLWAAQGVTDAEGRRAAPSAGGLYPLEMLLVCGRVEGVAPGIYRYRPNSHALARCVEGDQRTALARVCWDQDFVATAAAIAAICAISRKTTRKYGERGLRYVHIEAGHVAQNICLMATELALHACVVGAFSDNDVAQVLQLGPEEAPLALLPVGMPPAR